MYRTIKLKQKWFFDGAENRFQFLRNSYHSALKNDKHGPIHQRNKQHESEQQAQRGNSKEVS